MNRAILSASEDSTRVPAVEAGPSSAEFALLERRARRRWVSAIVGLLGLQVVIGIGSVLLAVGDPTVAIVPNYHQKALDWDATQRAQHLTHKLGWDVIPLIGLASPETGHRLVRIAILDGQQQPVTDLNLSAKIYHHARGTEVHELRMVETDPGYYEATIGLRESGMWQLQLQIEGQLGIASDVREMWVE
jgi:hypothetical protein